MCRTFLWKRAKKYGTNSTVLSGQGRTYRDRRPPSTDSKSVHSHARSGQARRAGRWVRKTPINTHMMADPPPVHPISSLCSLSGTSVVSITQFSGAVLLELCAAAATVRRIFARAGPPCKLLEGRVLASVFYEPSTRTSTSFASAFHRLGGSVLQVAESTSSAAKGESLSDTIRSLCCYAHVLVLRHPIVGSAAAAARVASVPVLNAGDGTGEHPTQALLDLFTILTERGAWGEEHQEAVLDTRTALAGICVTMLGDLKHGRTVHSLAKLLSCFQGVTLRLVSPRKWRKTFAGGASDYLCDGARGTPSSPTPPPCPPAIPTHPSAQLSCACRLTSWGTSRTRASPSLVTMGWTSLSVAAAVSWLPATFCT